MDRRLLLLFLAGTWLAALAAPDARGEDLTPAPPSQLLPFRSELGESGRLDSKAWVRQHLRVDKAGIRYRDEFQWGGRELDFRVSGPVVRGAPGVRLELRGLRLRRYPVRIRAVGATSRQQLEIEFRF